jgi:hypothetical protein
MRSLMLVLLLALAHSAGAQCSAVLTWTPPTTNTDGSPLTNLASYRVSWGAQQGTYPSSMTVTAPANGATVSGLALGTHYFAVQAVNSAGTLSAYSNVASKTCVATPSPPTNLTVQQDLTAWGIVQSDDNLAMIPVGTVAVGATCDGSQTVNGRYRVPRAAVTFAGTVRPRVVFAACQ